MHVERLLSWQHTLEVAILAVEGVVAWVLPERAWRAACRALAQASSLVRRRATRQRSRTIERALPGQPLDRSAASIELGIRAAQVESRLQLLREYRPGGWSPRLQLHGRRHLEKALARGRGVILWACPFSSSDLVLIRTLHQEGFPVTRLSSPGHGFANGEPSRLGRALNRIRTRIEERYQRELVVRSRDGGLAYLRTLERGLAENAVVWVRANDEGLRTVTVPFLNRCIRLTSGPVALAATTGAALLPAFVARRGPNAWDSILEPALDLDAGAAADGAGPPEAVVRSYSALLEAYVLREPELWLGWSQIESAQTDDVAGARAASAADTPDAARAPLVERVGQLLRQTLGVELDDASLRDDLGLLGHGIGLDSVEALQLVSALEEEFDLTLEDDELEREHFETLGSLARFLEEKLAS